MKHYEGTCHCGAVKFKATLNLDKCYMCDCSICSSKGSIMQRVKPENFEILSGEEYLVMYQFNTMIAKHYFCKQCGIHTFHRPRSAPELWSVNVRCIPEMDLETLDIRRVYGSQR